MSRLNHIVGFLKSLHKYICLLWFISTTPAVIGQSINLLKVEHPGINFPMGVGTEDPEGYVWFGSANGIYRYDGYQLLNWSNDPMDSNSLAANRIESMLAARDNMIWIGTETSGLDMFDPTTETFTHFRYNPHNENSLTSDKITALLEDKNGVIWVGTHSGLNCLDPKTKKIRRYQHLESDTSSLSNNQVRALYEDRSGTIWVGTGSAFDPNPDSLGGLNRFIPATQSFKRYVHDSKNITSLIDNRVRAIFEDSRGVFWIGTAGDGLHTMDRSTGKFTHYLFNREDPGKLSRPPLKEVVSWATDHITFINEDAAGYIWIGTLGNGVARYDFRSGKIIHLPPDPKEDVDLRRQNSWWSLSTKDGNFWIGYWNGVYKLDPLRKDISFVRTGFHVAGIYQDSVNIWYGGRGSGLIRRNINTGEQKSYAPAHSGFSANNSIYSITRGPRNQLLIGTDNGLQFFNPTTCLFSRYEPGGLSKSGINDYTVFSAIEDQQHNIWFSTLGKGLGRIDPSEQISYYKKNPGDSNSLDANGIKCLFEDRDGNIWIGLYLGGVNKLKPSTGKIEHFLQGADVLNITQDEFGIIWAGTASGLYRSNESHTRFLLFRDAYNEVPANIRVGAILEDNYRNLWMSSSVGILKLSPKREKLVVWAKNDRVDDRGFKSKQGQLYFGDSKGYFAFYPGELRSNPNPPQIHITNFRVGDKPAHIPADGLRLEHYDNSFSFQFAGIHYTNPSRNRHLYRLEGYDNEWRSGNEDRTASYSNVQPGKYVFRIRAINSDGISSEEAVPITIYPPFWKTWWAYLIYAVITILIIWLFISYRVRSFRSRLLEKEREIQFEELRRQKSEIEMQALRAQMNPHFIFNSLNSINRFILQNNKNEASEYLSKFSMLVRLILNHSQASSITLQSELDALHLYLELESLRFKNHFKYEVRIDDSVDPGVLRVPPLIVQPFVENAIWHGLMQKPESGNLEIDFSIEDGMLLCRVKDDGIGRKAAAEINSKSRVKHKSYGMKITTSRIALLQKEESKNVSVTINDLILTDNSSGGTEVVIKLPVRYD